MINVKWHGYTFDDLLLIPKNSKIDSRSSVDVSTSLGKGINLDIPIISSNMKNVTGVKMAKKIADLGGLAILHRFCSEEERLSDFYTATLTNPGVEPGMVAQERLRHIGISVGVSHSEKEFLKKVEHIKIVCVDVAHGDHEKAFGMVDFVSTNFPDVLVIAGNVVTGSAASRLSSYGADVVKCGIGSGALCTTRIETGNGVPQMTALEDVYNSSVGDKFLVVADGGIKRAGDITKALCFSHAVMLGSMLAGTDEAPGDIITFNGKKFKPYSGSSTHKSKHVEGVRALSPYKGSTDKVVEKIIEGLRSGLSYQGAINLEELRKDPQFVSISNSGLIESHPHSVVL